MARIFVSYSRADKPFLEQFLRVVQTAFRDHKFWHDSDIVGGSDWWQAILAEIERCDLFIYLISNESLTSTYCQAELREALRLKKPILPIIVRRLDLARLSIPPDINGILQRLQQLDFSDGFQNASQQATAQLFYSINQQLQAPKNSHISPKAPTSEPIVEDKIEVQPPLYKRKLVVISAVVGLILIGGLALLIRESTFSPETPTSPSTTAVVIKGTETPIATPTIYPTVATSGTPLGQIAHNADWQPQVRSFVDVEMVLVPAGCFTMGSEDGDDEEKPAHQVCITKPFYLDRFEVTNAQFEAHDGTAAQTSNWKEAQRPRENITWTEAKAYCEKRGGRLPTEAEWEFAARGPDDLRFPWGNEFVADNIIFGGNSGGHTAEVGAELRASGKSWVGAYDLSGNVFEWVEDWFSYTYPNEAQTDPSGAESGSEHVIRSGSFDSEQSNVRGFSRSKMEPESPYLTVGFRCAQNAE